MKSLAQQRVLALNVRPLSFGFVVFEGPEVLVEWGRKSFRNGVNAVKVPMNLKLASLIDQFRPDVVVVNEPVKGAPCGALETIVKLAKLRNTRVRLISRAYVRQAFQHNNRNKYQIATVIARQFPELSSRLGARRRVWQPERYSMSIFDAAALGIAYFTHLPAAKG